MSDKQTIKSVVLDLDDTLIDFHYDMFPETVAILNFFQDNNLDLYIASFNLGATRILKELGLLHYFLDFSCGKRDPPTKLENLTELPVDIDSTVFFDDNPVHIATGRAQGWNFIHVSGRVGINWKHVESVFKGYDTNKYKINNNNNNKLRDIRPIINL
jgi:phosphoglycolate phosphatase-like HAD superfamily hydrolase